MRVWDIQPGYLNRQSLLGEHTEIHALISVVENQKRGFARHPETLRWKSHLGALRFWHDQTVAEMVLRGYQHHSPVGQAAFGPWPELYLDAPGKQFALLRRRYRGKESGRLPLPRTNRQLWAQHRYSVLARDPGFAHRVEQLLGESNHTLQFSALAAELVRLLRQPPNEDLLTRALAQMLRGASIERSITRGRQSDVSAILAQIVQLAPSHRSIQESTALSDFAAWLGRVGSGEGGTQ
jgi:hypothetical protein